MRKIIPFIILLAASSVYGQPLLNQCQQLHQLSGNFSKTGSAVTDYDIIHFNLHVDDINYAAQELTCHAGVTVVATAANVSSVQLDLLGFTIDSIVSNGYNITHTYNDTVINVQLTPFIS